MRDIFDITGKIAVVIGGGGGIGSAIAKGFAFYGAKVIISGRTDSTLKEAADEILADTGASVDCMTVDSCDHESVARLRDAIVAKYETVDILVNAQGVNSKFPALKAVEHLGDWDKLYETNVRSLLICCTTFAQTMSEKNYGKIINISSIRGSRALKGKDNVGYGSAKGAVDMMTKYLAAEWGIYNITVNAIGPIVTVTPMMKKLGPPPPGVEEHFKETVPMERMGVPEDNIGPAVFLASDASAFVTGQVIYPDGGLWCV